MEERRESGIPSVMTEGSLHLRHLGMSDRGQAESAHREFMAEGHHFLLGREDKESWAAYIAKLSNWSKGLGLYEPWVPGSFYGAFVDDTLIGRVSLRHELDNEYLRVAGGHIGYCVLPTERRKGYATEMLRLALFEARAKNIDKALVTCDPDNVASRKVIENNGGLFGGVVQSPRNGDPIMRFWIPTPKA